MGNLNAEQAIDLLDKMDFFQGQRAGRELWNDKPFDVQEQDIANFSRDVALIKRYINELTAENERLKADKKELINDNAELKNQLQEEIATEDVDLSDELLKLHIEGIEEAKAYTVRKMQSEIKKRCIESGIYPAIVKSTIDKVAKEMLDECKK